MKLLCFTISLFLAVFTPLIAEKSVIDGLQRGEDIGYVVRLKNGDVFSGHFIEYISDSEEGEGIKLETELGVAIIYAKQIEEIEPDDGYYKHQHRIYLMPTAEPIDGDHFAGFTELLMFYAGGSITKYFSFTMGRTIIPGIASKEQFSTIGGKVSFFSLDFEKGAESMSLAVGGQLSFINHNNRFMHYYGAATVDFGRTSLTGLVFTKTGNHSFYIAHAQQSEIGFFYENGAFGVGLGLDSRLPNWRGVHLIGEIWNSNVQKPTNSGVLLGLRLCNSMLSTDFGLAFFTTPFAMPFVNFVVTPF